jgi:hypothetical protein
MENGPTSPTGNSGKLKNLDWPTLVLILVTGGGNFIANQNSKSQLSYEQQEALGKIRELHQSMDDFEARQKQTLDGIGQALKNQAQMLDNQKQMLEELHAARTR